MNIILNSYFAIFPPDYFLLVVAMFISSIIIYAIFINLL